MDPVHHDMFFMSADYYQQNGNGYLELSFDPVFHCWHYIYNSVGVVILAGTKEKGVMPNAYLS
jgi:uncharacterized membrane protein